MAKLEQHLPALRKPPIEYRPEQRWWLAEGLHTDQTLRHEIAEAHRLGFGGMEFLAMDEGNIDHSRYGWGSEELVHDSALVVAETTAKGMSVSFTSGTNWSNANLPTIDPDHPAAAQELNFCIEDVQPGANRNGELPRIDLTGPGAPTTLPGERVAPTEQHLVAVVAAALLDDQDRLDAGSVVDLTDQVTDRALSWTAPDHRNWRLFVFWSHGTGQTASPSASVNYTINYLDRDGVDALIDYWREVVLTPELKQYIAQNPRAQMYMDSLELNTWGRGGMLWGRTVPDEFRTRRGYDIAPWLPFLVRSSQMMAASSVYHHQPDPEHRVEVEKVRFDYARTLTDLYIENLLRPFAAFLHENDLLLRAEISYGLPFELTRPGPEVDGIETESLEFGSQIDAYRMLAGPSHLFGKQYSSETGATTRNHMLDHRFYDQIIATQLAAGITKTVLHGWSSTAGAEGTEWPGHEGMWPMFSERFDTRQPASEFYPLWNDAIGRYQYLLRQGQPRIDVGILRTDHAVDNTCGLALIDEAGRRVPDEEMYAHAGMRNRQNHWWQDLGMQDAGWSYDFFDGDLLRHPEVRFADGMVQPDGPGYQALIVYQESLDPDVAALLLDWARQGLKVLIVNGARDLKLLLNREYTLHEKAAARTPGRDGRDAELAATMAALRALPTVAEIDDPAGTVAALRQLGVAGRAEFTEPNPDLLTYLREDGELLHLYAYHFRYESGESTRARITLPGAGTAYRVDPWSGQVSPHRGTKLVSDRTVLTVDLAPGETALFVVDRSAATPDTEPATAAVVSELTDWSIVVESWDAGEPQLITEDRGLGYITREVRPTTAVERLVSPSRELASWTELEGVGPEVSGVGEYTASFALDSLEPSGRYLLDLGSTAGGLGAVRVNGGPARGFDTSRPVVDITEDLSEGTNQVVARTASSLNNRLLARGYYDQIPDVSAKILGHSQLMQTTHPREYGLLGPVRLLASI